MSRTKDQLLKDRARFMGPNVSTFYDVLNALNTLYLEQRRPEMHSAFKTPAVRDRSNSGGPVVGSGAEIVGRVVSKLNSSLSGSVPRNSGVTR